MKITVKQVTTWERVADAARMTVDKHALGHEPSEEFKRRIMRAQHSPIRLLEFDIIIEDIPHFVAMHLVRHTQGVEKFVATQREDRTGVSREERGQTDPVNMMLSCNAQALINISRKRLCGCADLETRKTWKAVTEEIGKIEPIVAKEMVPECVFRGFCPEMKGCGHAGSALFDVELEEYRKP